MHLLCLFMKICFKSAKQLVEVNIVYGMVVHVAINMECQLMVMELWFSFSYLISGYFCNVEQNRIHTLSATNTGKQHFNFREN